MNKHRMWLAVMMAISFMMMACSKTDSDDVKTSGFYATLSVDGNNSNQVTCRATFQVGGATGTYLDLSSGDTVTCNGQSMSRSEFLGMITYTATATYQVGATYSIVLTRAGESPYTATAVLPEAITVTSPTEGQSVTKGTAPTATWTSAVDAGAEMAVTLSYTVNSENSPSFTQTDTAPEQGTLGWSTTQTQVSPPQAGSWSGKFRFVRSKVGSMPAGLDGSVRATQSIERNISLVD